MNEYMDIYIYYPYMGVGDFNILVTQLVVGRYKTSVDINVNCIVKFNFIKIRQINISFPYMHVLLQTHINAC